MILNPAIHDQLAAAHTCDLLKAADHAATHAQRRLSVRSVRFTTRRPRARRDATLQRCLPSCTASR